MQLHRTFAILICLAMAPLLGPLRAQPILELVEDRGHYLLMNDVDGLFERAVRGDTVVPNTWEEFQPALYAIENGYRARHRDNSQILITFSFPPLDHFGYHRPLANDVHGLGHAHWGDSPHSQGINGPGYYDNEGIWDGTPNSAVRGLAYLGAWTRYVDSSGVQGFSTSRLKSLLSHEVGHSWLAFPWYLDGDGEARRNLLDWEETHWSVYVDSGIPSLTEPGARSLLGGHDWVEFEPGSFRTTLKEHERDGFSDLDLYLLGALPPEQVEPFLVIENPANCTWQDEPIECEDPLHANLGPPGGDFAREPIYTVEGEARLVSVDDIVAVEGRRIPGFVDAPEELPVTFLVIKRPETVVSEADKLEVERLVQRSVEIWNEMTRGLYPMVNRSSLEDRTPGIGAFTCVEDANTMCLVDGRFQVRVQWRTAEGGEGLGTVVDFATRSSGLFWFFGEDNWEVMLKVLDACGLNERYWVFAAATTDVAYTLTVTDTTTGESRRYQNALGQRSEAFTDIDAFACP